MLSYETFKKIVQETFLDYFPDEYKEMKVEIRPIRTVNQTLDAINFIREGTNVSPSIYVNNLYKRYVETQDLDGVLYDAADIVCRGFENTPKSVQNIQDMLTKDRISFQLVNTAQNEEMLRNMPHRSFHDLSVIYHVAVNDLDSGLKGCVKINNAVNDKCFKMTEEELFETAKENTKHLYHPYAKNMNEIFEEMGMPIFPDEKFPMWVISNEEKMYGAVSMLYEDLLQNLAEQIKEDFYILPSSIHEVIAMPASMGKPDVLAQMVTEINGTEVSIEERLSNQVYFYDKELGRISLVTDTAQKSLDDFHDNEEESDRDL